MHKQLISGHISPSTRPRNEAISHGNLSIPDLLHLSILIFAAHFQEKSGAVGVSKIKGEFATLLKNVCKKLKEKSIDFEGLHTFLTSYFSPGKCIPKSSSIHEIFDTLNHHKLWDYWNYYPLEELIKGFAADDPEIKLWLETYKQHLKLYKETTKLTDLIAVSFSIVDKSLSEAKQLEQRARYNKQYYQTLSFKLQKKLTDHTVSYIDDLWDEFTELNNLPRLALLDCIHEGCVSIVWLIPCHLAPHIRSTTPLSADFYCKHEITRVDLGEECIYQEEEEHHKVCMYVHVCPA